eukprot:NODE_562_length_6642_cov_0.053798.p4 type:complete len:185 gc:universal NODE_562_length_6642_cov_0.053798:2647-3201(+)
MSDNEQEHFEPTVTYEPVVHLEKIEVKSLEEDEVVLYKQRAKLFRFDSDAKEWKERGIGDVKFLLNKSSARVRLLMRRDKIQKVCANHYLTAAMELKANVGSDKSWVYTAEDFTEGVVSHEQFAFRFKNSDIANLFKSKFEECAKWNELVLKDNLTIDDAKCPKPDESIEKQKENKALSKADED